jgi:hypothetical protein
LGTHAGKGMPRPGATKVGTCAATRGPLRADLPRVLVAWPHVAPTRPTCSYEAVVEATCAAKAGAVLRWAAQRPCFSRAACGAPAARAPRAA